MSVISRLLFGMLIVAPFMVMAEEEISKPGIEEMVPPPPPGPYMSTALSDNKEFIGGQSGRSPLADAQASPFFSPDMPWPDKTDMTHKWMPEDGYTFAPPMPAAQMPRLRHQQMRRQMPGVWGNLMAPPAPRPMQRPDINRSGMNRPPVARPVPQQRRPPMQRPAVDRPPMRQRSSSNRPPVQRPPMMHRAPQYQQRGNNANMRPPAPWLPLDNYPAR